LRLLIPLLHDRRDIDLPATAPPGPAAHARPRLLGNHLRRLRLQRLQLRLGIRRRHLGPPSPRQPRLPPCQSLLLRSLPAIHPPSEHHPRRTLLFPYPPLFRSLRLLIPLLHDRRDIDLPATAPAGPAAHARPRLLGKSLRRLRLQRLQLQL